LRTYRSLGGPQRRPRNRREGGSPQLCLDAGRERSLPEPAPFQHRAGADYLQREVGITQALSIWLRASPLSPVASPHGVNDDSQPCWSRRRNPQEAREASHRSGGMSHRGVHRGCLRDGCDGRGPPNIDIRRIPSFGQTPKPSDGQNRGLPAGDRKARHMIRSKRRRPTRVQDQKLLSEKCMKQGRNDLLGLTHRPIFADSVWRRGRGWTSLEFPKCAFKNNRGALQSIRKAADELEIRRFLASLHNPWVRGVRPSRPWQIQQRTTSGTSHSRPPLALCKASLCCIPRPRSRGTCLDKGPNFTLSPGRTGEVR
jgi:hypothetical protein